MAQLAIDDAQIAFCEDARCASVGTGPSSEEENLLEDPMSCQLGHGPVSEFLHA